MTASSPRKATTKAVAPNAPLLLNFVYGETDNTVSRDTVREMAKRLGFNETQTAQYALARLRASLVPAYGPDAPDLSKDALKRVKSASNQKDYKASRTLIEGL